MKFIDKIIKLCTLSTDRIDIKKEYFHKSIILNFYSCTSLFLLLVFGFLSFAQDNFINVLVEAALLVILIINLFIFFKRGNYLRASNVFTIIFGLFLFWLLYSGSITCQGIVFFALFPAFIILLLGKKRGNIASLIFFVLTSIAILFPSIFKFSFEFNLINQIVFAVLYVACFIFLNIYENLWEIRIAELNIEIQKAKHETQAKEEFISKISHQIRTPLNNLVVVTNIVNTFDLDEKQKDLIGCGDIT
mgnify:CR=1 FL=1